MRYWVTHSTTYSYSEPVPLCMNLVHLRPRDSVAQKCEQYQLSVVPTPSETDSHRDYFGNRVNYFAIHESHRRLRVTAKSRLAVIDVPPIDPDASPTWESVAAEMQSSVGRESLDAFQFLLPSPHVSDPWCLRDYGVQFHFTPNRPVLSGAIDLTRRIHADFQY